MWSIYYAVVDGLVHVRASRWGQTGPYPTQLLEIALVANDGESELLLMQRVARAVEREARERRFNR